MSHWQGLESPRAYLEGCSMYQGLEAHKSNVGRYAGRSHLGNIPNPTLPHPDALNPKPQIQDLKP